MSEREAGGERDSSATGIPDIPFISNHPEAVVVFNPSTFELRFGFAKQQTPEVIPHVIAVRKAAGGAPRSVDNATPATPSITDKHKAAIDEMLKVVFKEPAPPSNRKDSKSKSKKRTSSGNVVIPQNQNYTNYQESNCREQCPESDEDRKYWISSKEPLLIGQDVFRIPDNEVENYDILWPLRNGAINFDEVHSLQTVVNMMSTIWEYACTKYLKLTKNDFKSHSAVLVVPDTIERRDLKELINILLNILDFKSVLVHQESVCATFGAGLSTACVVDMGAIKTNICCVEDGVIVPDTRFCMSYGGEDITKALIFWLQSEHNKFYFPFKEPPSQLLQSFEFKQGINRVKENHCHMQKEDRNIRTCELVIRKLGAPTQKYRFNAGDVLIYASYGLFYPKTFEFRKRPKRKADIEEQSVIDLLENPPPDDVKRKVVALDVAVLTSINQIGRLELIKRLFSNILLVGGIANLKGIKEALEERIIPQLPPAVDAHSFEIIGGQQLRREQNPKYLSWRGGAVISFCDGSKEMWIRKSDLEKQSLNQLLRNKLPFVI